MRKPRPPHRRDVPTSSERGGSLSPSCNAADQAMLLRDLERRIKTMALAEEHQVVDATAVANVGSGGASERERGDGVTSSSSNRDGGENREGRSQSCFMLAAYRSLSPPSSSAPRPPPTMVSLASPLSVDLPAAESPPPHRRRLPGSRSCRRPPRRRHKKFSGRAGVGEGMTHVLEGAAEDDRSCPKDWYISFSGKNHLAIKVVSELTKY